MPSVLRLGARGSDVALLHQQLAEQGALTPDVFGDVARQDFGEATRDAVATFQALHGLAADGVVGPKTWAALAGTQDDGRPPDVDPLLLEQAGQAGTFGRLALLAAATELRAGVREIPPGTNRGPRVDVYLVGVAEDAPYLLQFRQDKRAPQGWGGAPWCGRFARWCVDAGAKTLGQPSPLRGWGDLASARKWADAARVRRSLDHSAKPGRVGIILTGRGTGHLVLVAKVLGDRIVTLEGNSNNRVASRDRVAAECNGGFVEVG